MEQEGFLKQAARLGKARFADRLAYFQCELIALHPFYELNGRITRLFFDLLAVFNGYDPIDYSLALNPVEQQPNAYIQASIACVQQADCGPLRRIIFQGLAQAEENP